MDNQPTPPPQNDIDARIAAERRAAEAYQHSSYNGISGASSVSGPKTANPLRGLMQARPILLVVIPLVFLFGIIAAASQSGNDNRAHKTVAVSEDTDSLNGSSAGDYVVGEDPDNSADNPPKTPTKPSASPSTGNSPSTPPKPRPSQPIKTQPVVKHPPTTPIVIGTPPTAPPPKPPTPPSPPPTPPLKPKVTKVLVIIEENSSLSQMLSGMPFAKAAAATYGYATQYYGKTHPSLPNYIAIASGSTFSVKDDKSPSTHKLKGQTVFGRAIARGKTAKTYAESMTSNCKLSDSGDYKVKHNPWAYFVDERSLCNKYDVPFTKFSADVYAGKLPNVGMVIPNICHDAHDCSLRTADNWFKSVFTIITKGPDWKAGRLVIILTADEDDRDHNNNVLTVVIHPSIKSKKVTAYLTHYSLTRLYSEVVGASPLRDGAQARSINANFGFPM